MKDNQNTDSPVWLAVNIPLSALFIAVILTFSTKNKTHFGTWAKERRHTSTQHRIKINYACMQAAETQSIIQNQYSLWVFAQGDGKLQPSLSDQRTGLRH